MSSKVIHRFIHMWKTRLRQPVSRIFSDQVVSFRDPAAADILTNWSGKNGERAVKSKKRLVLTEHRPPRKKRASRLSVCGV